MMNTSRAIWDLISPSDITTAAALGDRLYPDYPEDLSVFKSRFDAFHRGFYSLKNQDGIVIGYAVFYPCIIGQPPYLNEPLSFIPPRPDCLHLHDIAIDEQYRGRGFSSVFMSILQQNALSESLRKISLIAIGGTESLWTHFGFSHYQSTHSSDVCLSYSDSSIYMIKNLS